MLEAAQLAVAREVATMFGPFVNGKPDPTDPNYLIAGNRRLRRMRGAAGPAVGQGPASAPPVAAVPVVPFDQAAHRGKEPGPAWSVTPGANQQVLGPTPLPAQGYLRRIIVELVATGGAGTTGVGQGDYPWCILQDVRLQDTNGAPLLELSGYNLLLSNIYGGYAGSPDPRNDPDYSANGNNPAFQLSIPVEIAPNGLGSLANQSSSAAYKLTMTVGTSAQIWSSAPGTTIPTFSIATYMDFWTLPAAADQLGRLQQQKPPFNGTAQYWSQDMANGVNSGQSQPVSKVGNLIRTLAFVFRVAGARSETPTPNPFTLAWDGRNLMNQISARTQRKVMREMVESLVARDTGVYVFPFSYGEGRHVGELGINSWLATVTATRLELDNIGGAGTADVVTNDVSVAEVDPALRAIETSATGIHVPVAPIVMSAQ